jgi:hypothetical protein
LNSALPRDFRRQEKVAFGEYSGESARESTLMFAFDDDPPSGAFPKWFGGAVVAGIIAIYGLSAVVNQEATLPRRGISRSYVLEGASAVVYGVAVLGVAIFVHCHYFWGNSKKLAEYFILGKMIGAGLFGVGMVIVLIRLLHLV